MELVSPIMSDADWVWSDVLDTIFESLDSAFVIHVNAACSMHVHIKPVLGWNPAGVRSLAKAAAVFDDAITKIMPPSRKLTPWARSSFRQITRWTDPAEVRLLPALSSTSKDLAASFHKVTTGEKTWKHLFDHFESKIKRNESIPHVFDDRNVSMNFLPINNGICGTVEFRRPPGVETAQDAQKWAAFALAFMSASLTPAWAADAKARSSTNKNATVAELQTFLQQGLTHLAGATGIKDWKSVMVPKSFVEHHGEPYRPSQYGPGAIHAKLEKAAKGSSFEQKVRLLFSFLFFSFSFRSPGFFLFFRSGCSLPLLSTSSFSFLSRCSLPLLSTSSFFFLSGSSLSFLSTSSFISYLLLSPRVFGFCCTCSRC